MALSGEFHNYPVKQFGLYCEWSGSQSRSGNYTDITVNVYLRLYDGYRNASQGTVTINGVAHSFTTSRISDSGTSWHNILLTTKTQRVTHNANGTKTGVTLSATFDWYGTYSNTTINQLSASTSVDLDAITTYTLTTNAGTGSSITVNRTSSGYASTGNITSGTRLYYGDTLRITFSPNANYQIVTHTVNGTSFTSGNTHTVSGNVSVVATAQVLASSVGATSANIGSTSTITVTKYNNAYYHSLQYSFGSVSGYIKADGSVSTSEVKFNQTSVAFSVPTTFYAQIPNSKTGTCTITCRTYSSASSTTILGSATTCTFTATASQDNCTPTMVCTVRDTNNDTKHLTGDSDGTTLIMYKSNALCTVTTTPRNSATISAIKINNTSVTGTTSNGVTTATKTYTGVTSKEFVFQVTDSRGYQASYTVKAPNITIIDYIQLTINPVLVRPSPTETNVTLSFSGNYYRGAFGDSANSYSNTLTVKYRYKESTAASYPSNWNTIASSSIIVGSSTYRSSSALTLPDEFDYQKSYDFQIKAEDGNDGITLTEVKKTAEDSPDTCIVKPGIPVFDWGKNDFTFHVPIKIGSTTLTEAQLQQLLALIT